MEKNQIEITGIANELIKTYYSSFLSEGMITTMGRHWIATHKGVENLADKSVSHPNLLFENSRKHSNNRAVYFYVTIMKINRNLSRWKCVSTCKELNIFSISLMKWM
jgi:hypothetical protein